MIITAREISIGTKQISITVMEIVIGNDQRILTPKAINIIEK
jgi:hypothetical protein